MKIINYKVNFPSKDKENDDYNFFSKKSFSLNNSKHILKNDRTFNHDNKKDVIKKRSFLSSSQTVENKTPLLMHENLSKQAYPKFNYASLSADKGFLSESKDLSNEEKIKLKHYAQLATIAYYGDPNLCKINESKKINHHRLEIDKALNALNLVVDVYFIKALQKEIIKNTRSYKFTFDHNTGRICTPDGLIAYFYKNKDMNERFVIFSGTTAGHKYGMSISDRMWKNRSCIRKQWGSNLKNLLQITPKSFKQASLLVEIMNSIYQDCPIHIIGHSKGGAEAIYAWGMNKNRNIKVTTFCSAQLSYKSIDNMVNNEYFNNKLLQKNVTNIVIKGDWVSNVPYFKGELPGKNFKVYPHSSSRIKSHDQFQKSVERALDFKISDKIDNKK